MIRRLLLALPVVLLSSFCAVKAQTGVPGQGMGIPSAAPGVQANLNAAADPSVNNDQTQGYQIGSLWQNANTGKVFIARSVATGAAAWTNLELADFTNYIANNWYNASSGGISSAASGTIKCYPEYIKTRLTIGSLGVRVSATVAGNVQAAVYANNPATMRPTGNPLGSTASMSTASAVNVNAVVTPGNFQIEPNLYWFCTNVDNATATFIGTTGVQLNGAEILGSATQANALGNQVVITGVNVTQTFGTWPSMTGQTFTETQATALPIVQFQPVSIP